MSGITQVGRVMVPVADQDAAIAFYTDALSFKLAADVPFGDGERWVEVAPPGGGTALALVPPRGDYQTGRMRASRSRPPTPAGCTRTSGRRAWTWTRRSWAETARCRRCSSSATTTRTR